MKRSFAIFCAFVLALSTFTVPASADDVSFPVSGECGENLTWTLDETGVLTVSGSGPMADYTEYDEPWYGYREDISGAVIGDGVTAIGDYAFSGCYYLGEADLAETVEQIGEGAFKGCGFDGSYEVPSSVKVIEDDAFASCGNLSELILSPGLEQVGGIGHWGIVYFNGTADEWDEIEGSAGAGRIVLDANDEIIGGTAVLYQDSEPLAAGTGEVYFMVPETASYELTIQAEEECVVLVDISEYGEKGSGSWYSAADGEVNIEEDGGEATYSFTAYSGYVYRLYLNEKDAGGCSFLVSITKGDGMGTTEDGYAYEKGTNEDGEDYMTITGYSGESTELFIPSEINEIPVRVIGDSAFWGNEDITKVVIPGGVTELGYMAFYGCSSLTLVEVPDTLKTLATNPFEGCRNFEICFPAGSDWLRVENECLVWNSEYGGVQMVSYLGYDGVEELVVPDGVAVLNYCCLDGLQIGKLVLPASVTDIREEQNNASVHEISFEGSNCNLTEQILAYDPDDGRLITIVYAYPGGMVEQWCASKDMLFVPLEAPTSGFCGMDLSWELTETEEGSGRYLLSITGSGEMDDYNLIYSEVGTACTAPWAFGSTSIDEVSLPEGLEKIGSSAFYGLSAVTEIIIPGNVREIGQNAFAGCSSLTAISIPDYVTQLPDFVFNNCVSLAELDLPDELASIGNGALEGCTSLRSFVIPDSVTAVGYSAFSDCTGLESVTLSNQLSSVSTWMFDGCSSLREIEFPASVKGIYKRAFGDCTSLKTIRIPETVETLAVMAFQGCTGLTDVVIEEGISSIPQMVFDGCTSLETIQIPKSVTSIERTCGLREITGLTIRGYRGSAAQTFAADNGIAFEVLDPLVLDDTYTVTVADQTYNGKEKKPVPVIKHDGTELIKGTDFTVSYSNNKNAGTAKVIITGIGDYSGTLTKTFTIKQASMSLTAKASASKVAVGKTVTVSTGGVKESAALTYKSSNTGIATVGSTGKITGKKAGQVTITVTAAATKNYKKASVKLTVTVVPAATTSVSAENQADGVKVSWSKVAGASGYYIYRDGTKVRTIGSGSTVSWKDTGAKSNGKKYTYKVTAFVTIDNTKYGSTLSKSTTAYFVSRPAVSYLKSTAKQKATVKWGSISKAAGYKIRYSLKKDFSSGVTTVSSSTASKTLSGLKSGKTYYVQVKAYRTVNGKKYSSVWSAVKSVKVK